MRALFAAALGALLVIATDTSFAYAGSLSTTITVSALVSDQCTATATALAAPDKIVTESCSDGTSATGLRQIARSVSAPVSAMVQPKVKLDFRHNLKTIDF